MAIYNTPDGRQVVGSVESGNDYHGFNGKRDIIIQLTADGATTDGLNALEYLKAYAVEQNKQNKPIFPNGTRVWISANGYTKAVEADDIVIDGENITVGGIAWNGEAWDFTNAGQTGGGASLPKITDADDGKVLTANSGVWVAQNPSSGGGVLVVADTEGTLDKTWQEIHDAMLSGGAAIVLDDNTAESVVSVGIEKGDYSLIVLNVSDSEWYTYAASSADGYPTL